MPRKLLYQVVVVLECFYHCQELAGPQTVPASMQPVCRSSLCSKPICPEPVQGSVGCGHMGSYASLHSGLPPSCPVSRFCSCRDPQVYLG